MSSEPLPAGAPQPDDHDGAGEIRAIVMGHGDIAAGLITAVAQITGRGSVFLPLSNRGLSGEHLGEMLREALDRTGAELVFTDLAGGSSTITARRLQRERRSLVVVTGVNLPMLLDFVFHGEEPTLAAAGASVEKGRAAITMAGAPPVHVGTSTPPVAGGRQETSAIVAAERSLAD